MCRVPLILQLQGRQGSSAELLKWSSLQRSQWGPSVLSLQLKQRPPLPVLRYCSASNMHWSDLPLQLQTGNKRNGQTWNRRQQLGGWELLCIQGLDHNLKACC